MTRPPINTIPTSVTDALSKVLQVGYSQVPDQAFVFMVARTVIEALPQVPDAILHYQQAAGQSPTSPIDPKDWVARSAYIMIENRLAEAARERYRAQEDAEAYRAHHTSLFRILDPAKAYPHMTITELAAKVMSLLGEEVDKPYRGQEWAPPRGHETFQEQAPARDRSQEDEIRNIFDPHKKHQHQTLPKMARMAVDRITTIRDTLDPSRVCGSMTVPELAADVMKRLGEFEGNNPTWVAKAAFDMCTRSNSELTKERDLANAEVGRQKDVTRKAELHAEQYRREAIMAREETDKLRVYQQSMDRMQRVPAEPDTAMGPLFEAMAAEASEALTAHANRVPEPVPGMGRVGTMSRTKGIIGTAKQSVLWALLHAKGKAGKQGKLQKQGLSVDDIYLACKDTPYRRSIPAIYIAAGQLVDMGDHEGPVGNVWTDVSGVGESRFVLTKSGKLVAKGCDIYERNAPKLTKPMARWIKDAITILAEKGGGKP